MAFVRRDRLFIDAQHQVFGDCLAASTTDCRSLKEMSADALEHTLKPKIHAFESSWMPSHTFELNQDGADDIGRLEDRMEEQECETKRVCKKLKTQHDDIAALRAEIAAVKTERGNGCTRFVAAVTTEQTCSESTLVWKPAKSQPPTKFVKFLFVGNHSRLQERLDRRARVGEPQEQLR